ncbi:hypothetical protein H8L47_00125 [Undibacterium sp. NL8W]|uniref:Uncharacterized protein n=2 Tax=Undibacterium umbellatum TaxID=2762300 RepID=A0ABR6Z2R7_9BURK|nr:hypothetical protein [Undibacterium umbellatum]
MQNDPINVPTSLFSASSRLNCAKKSNHHLLHGFACRLNKKQGPISKHIKKQQFIKKIIYLDIT